jgi:hypothetical protein
VLKLGAAGFERVAIYKRDEMLRSLLLTELQIPLKEVFSR